MNFTPKNLASFASIGSFTTAQELRTITTFPKLAPLSSSILEIGKAAYIGPAEILPKNRANIFPFNPESKPNPFIIAYFGISASNTTVRRYTTGIIIIISTK